MWRGVNSVEQNVRPIRRSIALELRGMLLNLAGKRQFFKITFASPDSQFEHGCVFILAMPFYVGFYW